LLSKNTRTKQKTSNNAALFAHLSPPKSPEQIEKIGMTTNSITIAPDDPQASHLYAHFPDLLFKCVGKR
jgi:hypothetical protein